MKTRLGLSIAAGCLAAGTIAGARDLPDEPKLTVLNPRGMPPPIRLVPMAPRLDTLDGKTVYLVGISFTEPVMGELHKLLQERYPKTTWVYKNRGGSFFADSPELWNEIKERGNAAILGIGH